MKRFFVRRYLLAIVALIAMAHQLTFSPAYAKSSKTQGVQEQPEYPPEELELLRTKFLELFDASKELASLLPDNTNLERLEKARVQIEQLSSKELSALRRGIDPSVVDWNTVAKARQTIANKSSELVVAQQKSRAKFKENGGSFSVTSEGFPVASPFCTGPVGPEAIIAVDAIYAAAELVRDLAQDTCKQIAVVAGFGANTSLACLIFDTAFNVDQAIWVAAHFCDDQFTKAQVDTSYARLDHIHNDLASSVANDNTNTASIIANTNTKASSIITNDNTNKAAIISNDNTNTTTITTAIANAVTTLSSNSGSTQNQVRDLILNTQIEAELARDTGTTPVASYELPASAGGQLDKVRAIVAQTITNVLAAGGSVGSAQSLLAQGDQQKAAGQFKSAYDSYRKAYQLAAR